MDFFDLSKKEDSLKLEICKQARHFIEDYCCNVKSISPEVNLMGSLPDWLVK